MRHIRYTLVIIGALGLAAAAPEKVLPPATNSFGNTAVVRAVERAHEALRAAGEARDAEALFAHVLENDQGSIIENGTLLLTRDDALAATRRGFQQLKTLTYQYRQHHITPLPPSAALWVAEGTATATLDNGREITAPFAETIVFVEHEREWKVLHAHRSSPPPRQ